MRSPALLLSFLLSLSFCLSTWLVPGMAPGSAGPSPGGVLDAVMGESRRLLANHFFVQADVYFHGGYYPSVFDDVDLREGEHLLNAASGHGESHADPAAGTGPDAAAKDGDQDHDHDHDLEHGDHEKADFLGLPLDLIDRFGRNFYPSEHVHAEGPTAARELLPWLRLSAEFDPQNVATYTVAAFWLRSQLGKVDEAEQFLREGWRENPDSPEILLELGRVFFENRKDHARARNVWQLALRKWQLQEGGKQEPNIFLRQRIVANLAELEELDGNLALTADLLDQLKSASPNPERLQQRIDELRRKARSADSAPAPSTPRN
jgi:tetratricopeptide (TPR) repeat protein